MADPRLCRQANPQCQGWATPGRRVLRSGMVAQGGLGLLPEVLAAGIPRLSVSVHQMSVQQVHSALDRHTPYDFSLAAYDMVTSRMEAGPPEPACNF